MGCLIGNVELYIYIYMYLFKVKPIEEKKSHKFLGLKLPLIWVCPKIQLESIEVSPTTKSPEILVFPYNSPKQSAIELPGIFQHRTIWLFNIYYHSYLYSLLYGRHVKCPRRHRDSCVSFVLGLINLLDDHMLFCCD